MHEPHGIHGTAEYPIGKRRTSRRTHRSGVRPSIDHPAGQIQTVIGCVSTAFQVRPGALVAATRSEARTAFARQIAMYLAHVTLGYSLSVVGRAFGRDRTTVSHAVRLVEDRRDDPRIDALVTALDAAIVKSSRLGAGLHPCP